MSIDQWRRGDRSPHKPSARPGPVREFSSGRLPCADRRLLAPIPHARVEVPRRRTRPAAERGSEIGAFAVTQFLCDEFRSELSILEVSNGQLEPYLIEYLHEGRALTCQAAPEGTSGHTQPGCH